MYKKSDTKIVSQHNFSLRKNNYLAKDVHHSPIPESTNWIAIVATINPVIRIAGPVI